MGKGENPGYQHFSPFSIHVFKSFRSNCRQLSWLCGRGLKKRQQPRSISWFPNILNYQYLSRFLFFNMDCEISKFCAWCKKKSFLIGRKTDQRQQVCNSTWPNSPKDPLQEWTHTIYMICNDCLISCYSKNNWFIFYTLWIVSLTNYFNERYSDDDTLLLIPAFYSTDINKL